MPENRKKRAARQKKYNARPDQIKRRTARNKVRRQAIRKHGKAKLKGKDLDHKDGNPLNNSKGNTRVVSIKKNRGRNNNKGK